MKIKIWCRGTSKNPNFNTPRWIEPHDYIFAKYNSTSLLLYLSGKIDDIQEFLDEFAVVRSTECLDGNLNEIWEGDVFAYEGADCPFGPVEYRYGEFVANVRGSRLFTLEELCYGDYTPPVVAGNVFENPELLKK
jgi:hypothetical protein